MAESVVSFVVERVGRLLIDEAKFLYGVRDQVEQVQTELRRMQCFLQDADERQYESETVKNLVEEIREIAYDAEDVIMTFIFKVASSRRRRRRSGNIRNILLRFACILNEGIALHKVGSEIESIKNKISSLTTSLQTYGITAITAITLGEASSSAGYQRQLQLRRSYSHVFEEVFVGLGGDVEMLVAQLVNEDKNCRAVSICGMGGLGKTTLAEKVYHHSYVRRHFDCFAWFCISQQWQKKDVLQSILIKLISSERDRHQIVNVRLEDLVNKLHDVQRRKKCLVVLDDIWSTDAWDSLKPAFPDRGTRTKILLTSRNRDVALYMDPHGFLHQPKCLNEEESWELLLKKAFPRMHGPDFRYDKKMEKVGKAMVGRCRGLPVAIILLGGILATKHTSREWEMVNHNLNWYLSNSKGQRGVEEVLALSYHYLPYQLKQCFLHLGNFPEDMEIKAKKLYHLWIAEGIISEKDLVVEGETMMDAAERYLGELAKRCMVKVLVKKYSQTERFKSCRLYDLTRDVCLSKVKEENFLRIIHIGLGNVETLEDSGFSSSTRKIRRLAIYYDDEIDTHLPRGKKKARHVRSVLYFHSSSWSYWNKMMEISDFKLLRILDVEGFDFVEVELPKAIGKLTLLRYLSLRDCRIKKLPSFISNLRYLQILDLRVRHVDYNLVREMENLRILYLPTVTFDLNELQLDGLSKLETLVNFDSRAFDVKDLFKLSDLRMLKATISGNPPSITDLVEAITTKNQLRRFFPWYL